MNINKEEQRNSVLAQILAVLPDGIFLMTPRFKEDQFHTIYDFKLQFLNASAYSFLNPNQQPVIGLNLVRDNLIRDKEIQEALLANNDDAEVFIQKIGKWVQVKKHRLHDNYIIRITDITINKEQQQRIERLAEKLQQAIDTSQTGTFYTSPLRNEKGEIVDWVFNTANQTIASLVNLKPEELIAQPGSKWFPAYKTNGLFDIYVEVYETGIPKRFEYHYYEEKKLDVWFDFMVTKFEDELLITLADFTTIKKLQLQLETYVHELKRSNESLEQFAYAASHDLQEPLRKISIFIDKLEQQYAAVLNDEAFSYIERIKTVARRMRRLIQDLLVFADVGAAKANHESVNLTQIVQDVVNDLEVAIEEREGKVLITELGNVKGDSIHLQQLFQNLISNSLKYSKPGTPPVINISSTLVNGQEIDLPLNEPERQQTYNWIELKDNGQGFNDDQVIQMFKIFQRLPQHRNESIGTGIGLAIVQRVVENHKGYIKAQGKPGEGATFSIYLPVD